MNEPAPMTCPDLVLHHYPGACSRVSICALEWAELPYRVELVDLAAGAQSSPAYRARSALGKVPMLEIDGEPLLENAAILTFVDALRPEAGLFPRSADSRGRAEAIGGLAFCGGTLHPAVRGLANPQRLTTGDGEAVRERSRELLGKAFAYADARLGANGWWLGERSIVDVYLDWAFGVARNAGWDPAPFPRLNDFGRRLADIPAYRRSIDGDVHFRAEMAS